ncbi:MAG TPA: CHAT domain-containing protein [Pirellulales bacterium]|jgi:tetratricopeptide (TPR) repeat protein|nr:CHAT domain-containing protein [Pirellulales bacterium]
MQKIRVLAVLWCFSGCWFASRPAQAQTRSIPSATYFARFSPLYDGDFADALDGFDAELKGAIKTVQSRWLDSICYHAMCGECEYELGKYPAAVQHYNDALNIYLAYSDWMLRVQFPPTLQAAGAGRPAAPWGASRRAAKLVHYPDHMTVSVGKLDQTDVLQRGGVLTQAMMYPVNVQEVCRCVALCLHRRRELLGPICSYDPLTKKMVIALQSGVTQPNHWSQAWVDTSLGIALASDGQTDLAAKVLERSLLVNGQYDHPLTCWGLLELGELNFEKGDLNAASSYLEEASYSAYDTGDYLVIEEAFRQGLSLHLLANKPGLFPPLKNAISWAKSKGGKFLYASLVADLAENEIVLHQTALAASAADELARLLVSRKQMAVGEISSRAKYVAALVQYQKGNVKAGDDALAAALEFKRVAGRWNYQINLAYELATAGDVITPRMAVTVYDKLLRDPLPEDWNSNPLESLSVLVSPNLAPFEQWFEIVRTTNQAETALEIADRIRRRRFFSTIHTGGRLLSLRWILEAPEAALDPKSLLQRQDLLIKFPHYAELAQSAKQLKTELSKLDLVPNSQDSAKQMAGLLDQLARVSNQQEAVLHEIAIRREPAALVFPPLKKVHDVQAALPDGTVLLMFFSTGKTVQATLLSNQKFAAWDLANPPAIDAKLVGLLRDLGNYDGNHELTSKDLQSETWKKSAKELMDLLVAGSRVNLGDKFDELVIVPEGALWFVPFEALQVTSGGKSESLLAHCRIRYAPTMGLAVPTAIPRKMQQDTAVVVGKLHLREDAAVSGQMFEQLHKAIPTAVALKSPLPGVSSVYRSQFDGLIVNDDINPQGGPYDWSPVQMDKGRGVGSLANWMSLPWGAPDFVIFPGFHTKAESQLKGANSGNDLFLSVCGLMSTGTRTILLSRWRTGGATSYNLVREFVKELPHTVADDAWQRSVQLVSGEPIIPELEPRVQKAGMAEPPKAENPFFWSGFMLVDSGVTPEKSTRPNAPPTIKPLKPKVGK